MKRIYIAGHNGMVGSAIFRKLKLDTSVKIITKNRSDLNLLNQTEVKNFLKSEKLDAVIIAAAKVGGIYANQALPAQFIYENLQIQNNIIHGSHENDIEKILFLGSSCIYPKDIKQPISEDDLLSGKLELTNEPYAIAKIAGIKMCESYNRQYGRDYRSVMPSNLYGEGDNFHYENSHVVPALIRRFHDAKINLLDKVLVWGSGKPKREFLYVDDMADACLHVFNLHKDKYNQLVKPNQNHINIGSGKEITIKDLAEIIAKLINFKGKILFDRNKPDGTPRKLMSNDLIQKSGWESKISLEEGLRKTYKWFLDSGNF